MIGLKKRQITSCLGRTGQHARRSRKHCKPCAKHAHDAPPRARTRLYKFHSVRISIQPVPVHMNNDLKQQRDGAAETTRNEQITSCLRRAGQHAHRSRKHCKPCAKHAHDTHARARACLHCFHSVRNSIQPVPVHMNNELKQQRDGAAYQSSEQRVGTAFIYGNCTCLRYWCYMYPVCAH